MANLHEKIMDIKRKISDLDVAFEDLRLTLIKDELDIRKTDVYKHWYGFYISFHLKP